MISSFPWHQKQEEKYKQTDLTGLNDVPLPQYQTETEKHKQTDLPNLNDVSLPWYPTQAEKHKQAKIYPVLMRSPSHNIKHKQK